MADAKDRKNNDESDDDDNQSYVSLSDPSNSRTLNNWQCNDCGYSNDITQEYCNNPDCLKPNPNSDTADYVFENLATQVVKQLTHDFLTNKRVPQSFIELMVDEQFDDDGLKDELMEGKYEDSPLISDEFNSIAKYKILLSMQRASNYW
eukprot:CAMPEP_0114657996 /NCGR_PEP_ID=MMETSP0191-20121206/14934_1 /TAXON_ID=126664 /ORGANISM="Sorites sp." /LENGTH=148 /DNA_ID=CAMNT_0001878833 /DNA_START=28 /DNA_END=471 /DNA_ORIENTATION=+